MSFMNEEGSISNLDFDSIPSFIQEYVQNFAKPLTVSAPELSQSLQLLNVVEDLEGVLDQGLDLKKSLPLLFVLWTNLIARMARVETLMSLEQKLDKETPK